MKSEEQTRAGDETTSARDSRTDHSISGIRLTITIGILILTGAALGQALYKYQDENGDWIYTDRPPHGEQSVETRELPKGFETPSVSVGTRIVDNELRILAKNEFFAPVEVFLALDKVSNVQLPEGEQVMRWIVDPRSELELMALSATGSDRIPEADFRFVSLHGDPRSKHTPERPYRAPYSVARRYSITQAFPDAITHNTVDSRYAVDIAMPIGTDIHAAREGVVFEVASTNFRGGTDQALDPPSANIVRILHDDGTHAVYAHLNWNSIRVQPGDKVERGEYIADSGNTGFSSGPHLHFAVLRNVGMRIESVPVSFEGPNSAEIRPTAGNTLTAY